MKVPTLKRMQTASPSAGQSIVVAVVSGPRRVKKLFPRNRVIAISKLFAATERNLSARSLWQRQTLSTNGWSEALSSNRMNSFLSRIVSFKAVGAMALKVPMLQYPDVKIEHEHEETLGGGRSGIDKNFESAVSHP